MIRRLTVVVVDLLAWTLGAAIDAASELWDTEEQEGPMWEDEA